MNTVHPEPDPSHAMESLGNWSLRNVIKIFFVVPNETIKARFNTWLIISPLLLATSYPVLAGVGMPQVCASDWVTMGIKVFAAISVFLSLATIVQIILYSAHIDAVSLFECDKLINMNTYSQFIDK